MKLCMFLPFEPDRKWNLARQCGVTHAVVKLAPELTGRNPPWDIDVLAEAQRRFRAAGLVLEGLEGDQMDMSRIKLGLDGRDEDLQRYEQMLHNMGELGIPLLCYNFMAGIGWFRTRHDVVERGGAVTCAFEQADLADDSAVGAADFSAERIWDNYGYFLQRVLPAAAAAGVRMGLHPDDPPVPVLGGYGRIFCTAEGFRRAMKLSSSPAHGITFCQATFYAMGEDVPALIHQWAERIVFAHFRDIRGTAASFVETFHDNGDHDMTAAIRAYREIGFSGPIRTDHAPSMEGEGIGSGYETLGHLFAIGYLKGILDSQAREPVRG
jgi:mannonate dehydratase